MDGIIAHFRVSPGFGSIPASAPGPPLASASASFWFSACALEQSDVDGLRLGPNFPSSLAMTSAKTGISLVSVCTFSLKRSASSVFTIGSIDCGAAAEPSSALAVMSKRCDICHDGPPSI